MTSSLSSVIFFNFQKGTFKGTFLTYIYKELQGGGEREDNQTKVYVSTITTSHGFSVYGNSMFGPCNVHLLFTYDKEQKIQNNICKIEQKCKS